MTAWCGPEEPPPARGRAQARGPGAGLVALWSPLHSPLKETRPDSLRGGRNPAAVTGPPGLRWGLLLGLGGHRGRCKPGITCGYSYSESCLLLRQMKLRFVQVLAAKLAQAYTAEYITPSSLVNTPFEKTLRSLQAVVGGQL